jgi:hypothetical protein
MKAMLEMLARGAIVAVAMVLAGCVADATESEDDTTGQGSEALVLSDGSRVIAPQTQSRQANASIAGSINGSDRMGEPEPNPWAPQEDDDEDTTPTPGPYTPNDPSAGQKK